MVAVVFGVSICLCAAPIKSNDQTNKISRLRSLLPIERTEHERTRTQTHFTKPQCSQLNHGQLKHMRERFEREIMIVSPGRCRRRRRCVCIVWLSSNKVVAQIKTPRARERNRNKINRNDRSATNTFSRCETHIPLAHTHTCTKIVPRHSRFRCTFSTFRCATVGVHLCRHVFFLPGVL